MHESSISWLEVGSRHEYAGAGDSLQNGACLLEGLWSVFQEAERGRCAMEHRPATQHHGRLDIRRAYEGRLALEGLGPCRCPSESSESSCPSEAWHRSESPRAGGAEGASSIRVTGPIRRPRHVTTCRQHVDGIGPTQNNPLFASTPSCMGLNIAVWAVIDKQSTAQPGFRLAPPGQARRPPRGPRRPTRLPGPPPE